MRTEVEDMRSSGSTVISATDVLAAYNGHKRRGKPRFFFALMPRNAGLWGSEEHYR